MTQISDIDWNDVYDAYGPCGQAPERIEDLRGDRTRRDRAARWIFDAVLHQGTPFPAATPLLRVVPGLLADPAYEPGHGDPAGGGPHRRRRPRIGDADRHFRDAGLPNDRRRLGDVLRTGRMPR